MSTATIVQLYRVFVKDFGYFILFQAMTVDQLEETLINIHFHNF